MGRRVLATDAARQAALRVGTLVHGSLVPQVQQILQAGRALSNPQVWDGPEAAQFRTGQWPTWTTRLNGVLLELEKLDAHAQQVIADIVRAGTQGSVGGTTPHGGLGPGDPVSIANRLLRNDIHPVNVSTALIAEAGRLERETGIDRQLLLSRAPVPSRPACPRRSRARLQRPDVTCRRGGAPPRRSSRTGPSTGRS
jgi:hypothetical protein